MGLPRKGKTKRIEVFENRHMIENKGILQLLNRDIKNMVMIIRSYKYSINIMLFIVLITIIDLNKI